MDILLLIYNLVLQILYCIPIVYALIFYQHTKRVLYLYVTGLFFSFSIENILICITEEQLFSGTPGYGAGTAHV